MYKLATSAVPLCKLFYTTDATHKHHIIHASWIRHTCILDTCIMDTCITDTFIMDTSIMDTYIMDTCIMNTSAWVTRPERPKGAKDEVKQVRRAGT